MKHIIKHGLGGLKCCTWVALAFGLIYFVWAGSPKLFYKNFYLSVIGVTTVDFFQDTLKGMVEPFRHRDQMTELIGKRKSELSSQSENTTRSKTVVEDKHFFKARKTIRKQTKYFGVIQIICDSFLALFLTLKI